MAAPRPRNVEPDKLFAHVAPVHAHPGDGAAVLIFARGAPQYRRTQRQDALKLVLGDDGEPAFSITLSIHLGRVDVLYADFFAVEREGVAIGDVDRCREG